MKASIKNTNLPYRGEPTKAVYKKPVVGDVSKYLRVELPCQYNPRPAPIPKLRKKRKAVQPKSNDRKRAVHRKPSFWTEERVSLLIDLHSQGLIYADIAVRMGTTKCAITSEVNRLVEQGILEPRNCGNQWNQDDIDRLVELKAEIHNRIEKLSDPYEKLILTERYLNNKSWEEISNLLHYEERNTQYLHGKALQHFAPFCSSLH